MGIVILRIFSYQLGCNTIINRVSSIFYIQCIIDMYHPQWSIPTEAVRYVYTPGTSYNTVGSPPPISYTLV